MKGNILGIFFIVLMIFGFFFGISFPNGFNMCDKILAGMGLKAWSNGTTGMHYSAICSLFLIIVALTGVNETFGKRYYRTTKIILFLLYLLFLAPIILRSFK